ncbi:hypothetical protein [Bradyrhizobium sp. NFR13]|uniref:hypothetical protein n=1 Tax=Bradyrhizobium sp. NFR13 TaxID=1566285 RepID=UPI000B817EE3|nr:hypothetical protein [Bradyrhizobium sp. NFR13]
MTMSATHPVVTRKTMHGLLPLWAGIAVYALLLAAGNMLLNDPDTYWQIAIGQSILDHHAVPQTDIYSFTMRGQPWISTQWLAQVLYALAYGVAGWAGPVVLGAGAVAVTIAMLTRFLDKRLPTTATLILVATALALMVGHLVARPHVLAMPVMVAWVAGLVNAMDRRSVPSFWLLPLMALWANLHGGFILGLALIGPIGIDAIWHAPKTMQRALLLRWVLFGIAALAASCVTPYGWDSLLASRRILNLGEALALIGEWRPANFNHAGPLELTVLVAFALALWRGITLPPMRIVLVIGFVFMALSHMRNAEVLALLAPLVLATPLGLQIGGPQRPEADHVSPQRGLLFAGITICLIAGTFVLASMQCYMPREGAAPAKAVTELQKLNLSRVFNDYDFGGYLIARGVPTFIDGRTELFGTKLMVDHNNASGLIEPDNLFRLLKDYDIEATLLRTQSAATKLLDRVDGWEKVYSDDIATIHLRKPGVVHSIAPAVKAN